MDIDILKLSTTELNELVAKIAEHRAKIAPHSSENPTADDPIQLGVAIRVGDNPMLGKVLAFRHPGLGWLCFAISEADIAILINRLTAPTPYSAFSPDKEGTIFH